MQKSNIIFCSLSILTYYLVKLFQNSTSAVEPCPFNAKHVLKRTEFRHHVATCPDRNRLGYEQMINETLEPESVNDIALDILSLDKVAYEQSHLFGGCEEDWDKGDFSSFFWLYEYNLLFDLNSFRG
jgi:hypothetical protein